MERAASPMQPLLPPAVFFPTLLVEPDTDNARTIKRLLERQGISVHLAVNAAAALER